MLGTSSGAAGPTSVVSGCGIASSLQLAWIGERACAGGRCGSGGAREVGAAAGALTPDEVAVRCRDAALSARHDVAIGAEAHGAAGFAPFEPGIEKNPV